MKSYAFNACVYLVPLFFQCVDHKDAKRGQAPHWFEILCQKGSGQLRWELLRVLIGIWLGITGVNCPTEGVNTKNSVNTKNIVNTKNSGTVYAERCVDRVNLGKHSFCVLC